MNATKTRPRWTDEEIGRVADCMEEPAAALARELGRSRDSIYHMRRAIRAGYSGPMFSPWSEHEDSLLMQSEYLTAEELTSLLPGRTAAAIMVRRNKIGGPTRYGRKSANEPSRRTVLAQTCKECGLLLAGSWFTSTSSGALRTTCRRCWSAVTSDPSRKRDGYIARAQAITLPLAENNGQEYTEADHKVLADPSTNLLGKALLLKRSYLAIKGAVHAHGYNSAKRLGSPEMEQWVIANPNIDRVDEIRAALLAEPLSAELATAGPKRPEFDWED